MMSAQQTNVVDVGGVAVPVSDQDRATADVEEPNGYRADRGLAQ